MILVAAEKIQEKATPRLLYLQGLVKGKKKKERGG